MNGDDRGRGGEGEYSIVLFAYKPSSIEYNLGQRHLLNPEHNFNAFSSTF